jgi:DNA polymerase/3'-5' exonuclease PolX
LHSLPAVENSDIARIFAETADLLELTDANPFKVGAYRQEASVLDTLPSPAAGRRRRGRRERRVIRARNGRRRRWSDRE